MRIFLLALALRIIPVLLTRQLGIGLDDMFQYDMLARSLASGHGFRWYAPQDAARLAPYLHVDITSLPLGAWGIPTTFRAPLYPAFVSVIYSAFGMGQGRFFAVRLAQTVLGALLAPLTYFAAGQLLRRPADAGDEEREASGERAARITAGLVAGYPMLIIFPLALATENLFFPLVLGSMLTLMRMVEVSGAPGAAGGAKRIRAGHALLAGLLLGMAALTRSVILPFAGLAVVWIWLILRQPRAAALTGLSLILSVAPWVLRNSILSHQLTGIETSLGYNLYVGYHPQSTGTFAFGPSLDLLSILNDQTRDQAGTQRALAFIREDPLRFPYLALRRLGYFFDLELRAFTYFYVNDLLGAIPPPVLVVLLAVLAAPFTAISLLGAFGAAALPWRPQTILLVLLAAAYLLPHVLILSEERFHLVLIPFLAICAANAWVMWPYPWKSRRVAFSAAVLVCAFLLVNWGLELARDWPTLTRMLGPGGNQLYLPY